MRYALSEPPMETPHLCLSTSARVPPIPALSINAVCVLSHSVPVACPLVAMTGSSSSVVALVMISLVVVTSAMRNVCVYV